MRLAIVLKEENFNLIKNIISGENRSFEEFLAELDKYQMLIIESDMENIDVVLENCQVAGVRVVLWGEDLQAKKLRDYFKKKLIYDYIDKGSYINLLGIIKDLGREEDETLLVSDAKQDHFIPLKRLSHIYYDRVMRRVVLIYNHKRIEVSKKLWEIEEYLNKFKIFHRIDRSTIINTRLIESINYREEYISFVGGENLYLSKSKLRELRDIINIA